MANNILIPISPGDKVKKSFGFSRWLRGSTIASATWTSENTSICTVSDDSISTNQKEVIAYFNVPSTVALNEEAWIKVQIVTNDTVARTESRYVQVRVVRKTG